MNHALTFGGDKVEINDCLSDLEIGAKETIQEITLIKKHLKDIQQDFFTEIKYIADKVHIRMPEPSEIELLENKIQSPAVVVKNMLKKRNLSVDDNFYRKMQRELSDITNEVHEKPGGTRYKDDLFKMMRAEFQRGNPV